MINQFRRYLMPLQREGLIENPWYCTELVAGDEWDTVIQQKFAQADIVFFMVSEHLMTNNYVLENELRSTIQRWEKDRNVRIVPIFLVPYPLDSEGPYRLGAFTGLPYDIHAVSLFADQHEAWDIIYHSVKMMLEADRQSTRDESLLQEGLKKKFESIIQKTRTQ